MMMNSILEQVLTNREDYEQPEASQIMDSSAEESFRLDNNDTERSIQRVNGGSMIKKFSQVTKMFGMDSSFRNVGSMV